MSYFKKLQFKLYIMYLKICMFIKKIYIYE